MDSRLGERIAHSMITLLVFGVGLLLGPRLCASPDAGSDTAQEDLATREQEKSSPPPREVTCAPCEQACPAVKIIYQCPPEPEPKSVQGDGPAKKVTAKKNLPPPEPELDPLARKRLLAWVRDQSDLLKVCRDDNQEIYRMAVIMRLDAKDGRVQRVDVNASRGVVPGAVLSCVKQQVRAWRPPTDLTQGRTQLVFGLTI